MKNLFFIFIGGGIGSICRFLLSNYTQKLYNVSGFPLGTFIVNILGCFLIGILSSHFLKDNSDLKFLLITGFCGGFTTFSAFSAENYSLWQNGDYIHLILYSLLSIVIGFIAVFIGLYIGRN